MNEPAKTCPQCGADMPLDSPSALCPKCLLQAGFETNGDPTADGSAYAPTFIAPTAEELAPHFPQLEILEQIGHGGMGVVYKARQVELDRVVALKIIRPGIGGGANFEERFQREARALATLNHPNIITVFDFGRKDGLFYFIMEYVDGTNLRHLERSGELSPQEALQIVPQICEALQYAHDNGIVHRDIKPENILINAAGDVRIADFGLAKLAGAKNDAPLTGTWQVMGTPHYMAPEQFEKPASVDHRADIFSLGVVIYELLTGELPLGRFPLPSTKAQIDVRLDAVVLRALDKEPERRYQHITDVATAVGEASSKVDFGKSTTGRAKEWLQSAAVVAGERVKSLRGKSGDWPQRLGRMTQWLSERTRGLGTALMWVGGFNAVCNAGMLAVGAVPHRSEVVFLEFTGVVAGCLAFWFGRCLRRKTVSTPLRWAAVFCLLPWAGGGIFFACVQVLLIALALVASHCMTPAETSDVHPPDVVDNVAGALRIGWQSMSRRMFLLTTCGILGWCAVWAIATFGFYQLWFHARVPSSYRVTDTTAEHLVPRSGSFERLAIASSGSGESTGMDPAWIRPERKFLQLSIGGRGREASLSLDFAERTAHINTTGVEVVATPAGSLSINRQTIVDWVTLVADDVNSSEVQAEIDNLYHVIGVMSSSRGVTDTLTEKYVGWYPSTGAQIESLLSDRSAMGERVIPVGRLFDPTLFSTHGAIRKPRFFVSPSAPVLTLIGLIAAAVWLVGMIRVLRVLYKLLWKPAFRKDAEVDDVDSECQVQWQWCTVGLITSSLIACFVLSFLSSVFGVPEVNHAAFMQYVPFRLPDRFSMAVLMTLGVAGIGVTIAALLARPILRKAGHRFGLASGIVAMTAVPLSLLTFPNGLAACVLLTTPALKRAFRVSVNEESPTPEVSTASTTSP